MFQGRDIVTKGKDDEHEDESAIGGRVDPDKLGRYCSTTIAYPPIRTIVCASMR